MRTLLLSALLPALAFQTASGEQFGDWTYSVENNQATVTGYTGAGGAVVIPSSVDGIPVVRFAKEFDTFNWGYNDGATRITSIFIPNTVTTIGSRAFYRCTGLTGVTIPNSVTSIENSAFRECTSLTSLTIPSSVTRIGESAFEYCTGLRSLTIPDTVMSIGSSAFYDCTGLTNVSLPDRYLADISTIGINGQLGTTTLMRGIADNLSGSNGFITDFTNAVISKNGNYGLSTKAEVTTMVTSATAPLATKTELASNLDALSTNPAFVAALVNNPAFMAALANQITSGPNNFGISIKQNQSLAFKAIAAQTYAANKTFKLAVTSSVKLTPITYTSSNPAVATVTSNVVKLIGKGTTTITATQAGNSGYNSASMSQQLTVK